MTNHDSQSQDMNQTSGTNAAQTRLVDFLLKEHANWRDSGKARSGHRVGKDERWFCSCGEQIDDNYSGVGIAARHRAHVAERIAAATRRPAFLDGYVAGFKRGGSAVARDVGAVLDGYDFAGNSLAKAVCEDYRETIRTRLRVALQEKPGVPE